MYFTICLRTDFLVTASQDGHVKFWKKQEEGVEFVKHFRAHLSESFNVCIRIVHSLTSKSVCAVRRSARMVRTATVTVFSRSNHQ